jgi:putative SOS response-associated peptidase YedK
MCNLYRMTKGTTEIARLFEAQPDEGGNYGGEVYPGYPGLVVAERIARTMTWGFPLILTGQRGQQLKPKAVNNARAEKLSTAFWHQSFEKRRCLIPVSAWAEAEGEKGRMTQTWYSLQNDNIIAVAGVWRPTQEWSDAYSMVMVDGSLKMPDVHDRMPLILHHEDWSRWTDGSPQDAFALCQTWADALEVDRTSEPWARARS